MPSGAHQRACRGKEKVLAEAAFALVQMARRFQKGEPGDETSWKGQLILTAKNSGRCKVALFEDRG
jgi:hypothetical protein